MQGQKQMQGKKKHSLFSNLNFRHAIQFSRKDVIFRGMYLHFTINKKSTVKTH